MQPGPSCAGAGGVARSVPLGNLLKRRTLAAHQARPLGELRLLCRGAHCPHPASRGKGVMLCGLPTVVPGGSYPVGVEWCLRWFDLHFPRAEDAGEQLLRGWWVFSERRLIRSSPALELDDLCVLEQHDFCNSLMRYITGRSFSHSRVAIPLSRRGLRSNTF